MTFSKRGWSNAWKRQVVLIGIQRNVEEMMLLKPDATIVVND
jgi:hypothetical protein